MKYREIKKIKTRSGINITNHGLFIVQEKHQGKEIVQIDVNGNKNDAYSFIDMSEVYRLKFMNDHLIVSFSNGDTFFYALSNKCKVFDLNEKLYFLFVKENDEYIYIENNGRLCAFNKVKLEMEYSVLLLENLQLFCLVQDNLIFRFKGDQLFLYKNTHSDVELSCQLDIKSLFPNREKNDIKQIKEYQGTLIVVTSAGILRLSAEDGSIIWKTEGYATTIEIVGNMGYLCTSICLFKINLDTGEESGYGWEKDRLPDFSFDGQEHWPIGHDVVYHGGLLWYSVYDSGESFLIAVNPENGNYEWIHHVDTNEKTYSPQFYEDRMFLWDTGNILHIYEKE